MGYGYSRRRGGSSNSGDSIEHIWAHQLKESKRNGNVFFEGKVIYSYGYHFPMARLLDDGRSVLITTRKYSVSTSAHQSATLSAVSHLNRIYCHTIPTGSGKIYPDVHQTNIAHWEREMKSALDGLAAARKAAPHIDKVEAIRHQVIRYTEYFKVKLKAKQRKYLLETDLDKYKEQVAIEKEKDNKKRLAAMKKAKPLHAEWLKAWRDSNEGEYSKTLNKHEKDAIEMIENEGKDANFVRLRVRGTALLTSKGISMPLAVAERFYRKYISVVAAGGCTEESTCAYEMLGYQVKEMTEARLLIGCHDIPRSEIDYVAGLFGWWGTATTKE